MLLVCLYEWRRRTKLQVSLYARVVANSEHRPKLERGSILSRRTRTPSLKASKMERALRFCLLLHGVFSFTPHHYCAITRQTTFLSAAVLEDTAFERSCQVDTTLTKLRQQLPLLLVKALDQGSAAEVYSEDVVLLGPNDEELASDRDELISLSTTLVTAAAATSQATKFARSLSPDTSCGEGDEDTIMLVSSSLVLDVLATLDALQVKWETDLLGTSTVSGFSELRLD